MSRKVHPVAVDPEHELQELGELFWQLVDEVAARRVRELQRSDVRPERRATGASG